MGKDIGDEEISESKAQSGGDDESIPASIFDVRQNPEARRCYAREKERGDPTEDRVGDLAATISLGVQKRED